MHELTDREKKIVQMCADGDTVATIASELKITPMTVHNHLYKARLKTCAANTPNLLAICMRKGWVE